MKYIIIANTHCSLFSEQREYNTEEEVIEAIKILLENIIMVDNIIIKEKK